MGSVTCLYRSLTGACALGHLIDDEHYDEAKLEMKSISTSNNVDAAVSGSIGRDLSPLDIDAFGALQYAHDGAAEQANKKDSRYTPFFTAFNSRLSKVPLSDEVRALVQEAANAEHN